MAVSKSFFADAISSRPIGTSLNETFGYMVYPKVSIYLAGSNPAGQLVGIVSSRLLLLGDDGIV